ncbi:MAG: heavy metal translocating P-type ATPase, partial [Rhodospirillales bacterium]
MTAEPLLSRDFAITGMTCATCSARIERVLGKLPGIQTAAVNLATERAHVETLADGPDTPVIIQAVERAGFGCRLIEDPAKAWEEAETQALAQGRRDLLVFTVSALLTAPFLVDMAMMLSGGDHFLPPLVQLLLVLPVQFGTGLRFYRPAWAALRAGTGNMDLLVVMGTLAAFGLSLYQLAGGHADHGGHLYFEASSFVITLILLGKALEGRAKRGTAKALRALMDLAPDEALILDENGHEKTVPASQLRVGDRFLLKPGSKVPVDGRILEGRSHLDEQMVTGESKAMARGEGDWVIAGTVNGPGRLLVEASAVGSDTQLAGIIRLVRDAQGGKAPIQRLVDRVAAVFVPVVVGIALVTLATWWLGTEVGWAEAVIHAVSVLVIACPCALGLATPAALMAGTGAAARAGILIRDIETLERARAIDTVVFDKTGTLTEGKPKVAAMLAVSVDEDRLVTLAAAAEQASEHPLAQAVVDHAASRGLALGPALGPVADFEAVAGSGLRARVEGKALLLGSRRFMAECGVATQDQSAWADGREALGETVIWVAEAQGESGPGLLGALAIGDRPRPSAAEAVRRLKGLGLRPIMLTGDAEKTAQAIGAELGLDEVIAEVRPEGKAEAVQALQAKGARVAMAGDGINDAPALAMADLGIAMGSGTDVAKETAGMILMRSDPALVVDALIVARATHAKIRGNLFWAFIYNLIGLPLAAFGLLTPAMAGAAMAFSSVSVVTNALLLTRWRAASGTDSGQGVGAVQS